MSKTWLIWGGETSVTPRYEIEDKDPDNWMQGEEHDLTIKRLTEGFEGSLVLTLECTGGTIDGESEQEIIDDGSENWNYDFKVLPTNDKVEISIKCDDKDIEVEEDEFIQEDIEKGLPNNEIWYKSLDDKPIEIYPGLNWGTNEILNNEYDPIDDCCKIIFKEDVIEIPNSINISSEIEKINANWENDLIVGFFTFQNEESYEVPDEFKKYKRTEYLTEILHFPKTIKKIGNKVFCGNSLEIIDFLPNDIEEIGIYFGSNIFDESYKYNICNKIKKIDLSNCNNIIELSTIGDDRYKKGILEELYLPKSLTSLEYLCISNINKLKNLSDLINLQNLECPYCFVNDLEFINDLPKLKSLQINEINDSTGYFDFTNINKLEEFYYSFYDSNLQEINFNLFSHLKTFGKYNSLNQGALFSFSYKVGPKFNEVDITPLSNIENFLFREIWDIDQDLQFSSNIALLLKSDTIWNRLVDILNLPGTIEHAYIYVKDELVEEYKELLNTSYGKPHIIKPLSEYKNGDA